MGSFQTILAIFMIFMAYQGPLSLATEPRQKVSTISAAPALLPSAPVSSPALSPDITPLFPSPGGMALPPSESSLPTIPSSRSPPNPEITAAPGNDMAFAPSGSLPASSSASTASSGPVISVLLAAMVAVCIMQVPGM